MFYVDYVSQVLSVRWLQRLIVCKKIFFYVVLKLLMLDLATLFSIFLLQENLVCLSF